MIKKFFFVIFWSINRFIAHTKYSLQNFLEMLNLVLVGCIMYSFVNVYMQPTMEPNEEGRYPQIIMSLS